MITFNWTFLYFGEFLETNIQFLKENYHFGTELANFGTWEANWAFFGTVFGHWSWSGLLRKHCVYLVLEGRVSFTWTLYRVSFWTGAPLRALSVFWQVYVSNFQTGAPLKFLSINWCPLKGSKYKRRKNSLIKLFQSAWIGCNGGSMHQPPPLKYTLRRLVTKWNAYGTFWGTIFSILVNFRGAPVLIH